MRIMRLLVMFDLPTKTKADKDNYIKFKRFLDDDGYQKEQNSVYSRNLLRLLSRKLTVSRSMSDFRALSSRTVRSRSISTTTNLRKPIPFR